MTMLTPLFRLFGALRRDTRAVALIEFAVVAPTLILLYLGSFVITDMISCNRKVTIAARELTDMSTRYAPTLPAATADITFPPAANATRIPPSEPASRGGGRRRFSFAGLPRLRSVPRERLG